MRFQSILLVAVATAFAYAQVSDVEDAASNEVADILSEVDDVQELAGENGAESQVDDDAQDVNNAPLEDANDFDGADDVDAAANTDDAEGSDDYDAAFATDGAEFSDDYEAATAVDNLDAPADEADEESEVDEEPSSNTGAVAAGVAGATAAAAGIFLWAKKSKKEELDAVGRIGDRPIILRRCVIM